MRLQHIDIQNVIGLKNFKVDITEPVLLVAGHNRAGKSSLAESVIHAITGDSTRVKLKKNYGELVHEGAKAGTAIVQFDTFSAALSLPNGKREGTGSTGANELQMQVCLKPETFAAMDDKTRRAFLLELMGVKISGKTVVAALVKRGVDEAKAAEVVPLLAVGFDGAAKEAAKKATEAKGAFRALTGENWGSEKAGHWVAPIPNMPPAYEGKTLEQFDADIGALNADIGALNERQRQHNQQKHQVADLEERAGKRKRIQEKLDIDIAARDEWLADVERTRSAAAGVTVHTLSCPECEAVLEMKNGALHAHQPQKQPDAKAKAELPEKEAALRLLENSVANGERDLEAAKFAITALTTIQKVEAPSAEELQAKQKALALAQANRSAAADKVQAIRAAQAAQGLAEQRTRQAAQHHADVLAWLEIAAALAPDGIQSEFLHSALTPFNEMLASEADAAQWPAAKLTDEMLLTYGGREYGLICESEQWRVDAMVAAVVAQKSCKFVLLDRFDRLVDTEFEQPRTDFFYWLSSLGDYGVSVLAMGSMKALPEPLPMCVQGVVLEAGVAISEVNNEEVSQ